MWFSVFAGQIFTTSTTTALAKPTICRPQSFGTSYNLGGSLNGLDVARDDSFLLVAQNVTTSTQGTFHKVQLSTGMVTNISYTRGFTEDGAWDVSIGSNGLALVTTFYAGS